MESAPTGRNLILLYFLYYFLWQLLKENEISCEVARVLLLLGGLYDTFFFRLFLALDKEYESFFLICRVAYKPITFFYTKPRLVLKALRIHSTPLQKR